MEAVFTVVIIFFFLLPGFLFRKAFWLAEQGPLNHDTLYEELLWSIPISFLFYVLSIGILNGVIFSCFFTQLAKIDLSQVLGLITGKSDQAISSIQNYPGRITVYFIALNSAAFFAGRLFHYLVLRCRWDIKFRFPLFTNKWSYILSGRKAMQLNPSRIAPPDCVLLNVLCSVDGKDLLYTGIVSDYHLNDRDFDYVVLSEVSRSNLPTTSAGAPEAVGIPKDDLIIKKKEVKNVHVQYVYLADLIKESIEADNNAETPPSFSAE